jgi:hypothetical protein
MNTDFPVFDQIHLLGDIATHPLERPEVRLALCPQGAGRIRKAARAATTPLSRFLAGTGLLRTRKGQAGAVKQLKRQQPRSRCFVPDTRPNPPSGAFNCDF